jgi:hypothetical protein
MRLITWWIWKHLGWNSPWLGSTCYLGICWEGLRKTTKIIRHYSQRSIEDSNRESPKASQKCAAWAKFCGERDFHLCWSFKHFYVFTTLLLENIKLFLILNTANLMNSELILSTVLYKKMFVWHYRHAWACMHACMHTHTHTASESTHNNICNIL